MLPLENSMGTHLGTTNKIKRVLATIAQTQKKKKEKKKVVLSAC
jgi:hypothetical protein